MEFFFYSQTEKKHQKKGICFSQNPIFHDQKFLKSFGRKK